MAEPLKNNYGPEIVDRVAAMVAGAHPAFDDAAFRAICLDGYDELELTHRARRMSDALAGTLPADREEALSIIVAGLPAENPTAENSADELTGMEPFVFLPFVFFVADHGLDHFEASMTAQYELTKRFTAEFSIRSFLEHHPDATLERLRTWATDPNPHVRRLVSEGTRPRLPWAPRLRAFQADPTPVLELLELLRDDPAEYVRRSVANNLNDIAKDHPAVVAEVAGRWWADGDDTRRRLLRHGLRTLIKQGDPATLAILGYGADSPVRVGPVSITPAEVAIGDKVRIEATVENPSDAPLGALVDLRVHFVKANGSTSGKVFKGGEVVIDPGGSATVTKTVSVAQHSTRTHYPGTHPVEVLLNGVAHPAGSFELTS
ncbi:MAG: DNA alkylation repair protein [Actinomycetota bacterium]|nr:DNA alkylation repair protein [Actinomycetota bacterium]